MSADENSPRWSIPRQKWTDDGRMLLDPEAMQYDSFFHDFVVGFARLILKTYRNLSGMDTRPFEETGMYYISAQPGHTRRCWCPQLHDESQKASCPFLTHQPGDKAHLFNPIGVGLNRSIRPCPDPETCHSATHESRHPCRNVVYTTYRYMYWFITHRVPLHDERAMKENIPEDIDYYLEDVFRKASLASGDDDGLESDPYWLYRKALVWGLLWELENPEGACPQDSRTSSVPWEENEEWVRRPLRFLKHQDKMLLRRLFNEFTSSYRYREEYGVNIGEIDLWTEVLPREMCWMSIECNKSIPETSAPNPDDNSEAAPRGNLKRPFPYGDSDSQSLEPNSKKRNPYREMSWMSIPETSSPTSNDNPETPRAKLKRFFPYSESDTYFLDRHSKKRKRTG
ncbi:unnamed protein product [Clonostachys rhizophaga]|uniref:Uncharacterized protein n=1 Tax=Clonostachys rhizophaga TaxID=160324 RepID=A0A9N9V729_9HYPO|nr:unnamed protein product [Clonostachys rhizophaga]